MYGKYLASFSRNIFIEIIMKFYTYIFTTLFQ